MSEGIGIDTSDNLDRSVPDEIIPVTDKDVFEMTRKIAKEYGLLVGLSSGAVMHGLFSYSSKLKPTDIVVVILADSGRAYLRKAFGL
jgi:cystathionine beta-synthase